MAITLQLVNPAATRVFMGTLTEGADLHASLVEVAGVQDIRTATFELLGGLSEVEFRAFDFDSRERKTPLRIRCAMEIVAGHGTIAMLDGEPHVHLHLAVAYPETSAPHNVVVVAGHCSNATAFAVEFTLTAYDGNPVRRAAHAGTGLMLWDLPPLSA